MFIQLVVFSSKTNFIFNINFTKCVLNIDIYLQLVFGYCNFNKLLLTLSFFVLKIKNKFILNQIT